MHPRIPNPATHGNDNRALNERYFDMVLSPFDPIIDNNSPLIRAIDEAIHAVAPGAVVLDAGCGPGNLVPFLERLGHMDRVFYIGIDRSRSAVALSGERLGSSAVRGHAVLADVRSTPISGTTDAVGGQDAQGRSGARPARSSMIIVMNALGSWKPRALARMRPMAALFDSAIPLVKRHSMVASIEVR